MYEYYDLDRLPFLSQERKCAQCSSYDRKYENGDFGQYLYEENGEFVLFDEKGCGCIKSIWMAVTSDETLLSFYRGDSSVPAFTATARELFSGNVPGLSGVGCSFEERGHYDEDDCHAGNILIQLPFTNGMKITGKGEKRLYYHILYETYPQGEKEIGNTSPDLLEAAFSKKRKEHVSKTLRKAVTVKNGYTSLFNEKEAGVIRRLTLIAKDGTDLSKVNIDMVFDGHRASDVACPLMHLFALPCGFTEIFSHGAECHKTGDEYTASFYLPMPYWESAEACLYNPGEPVCITVEAEISDNPYPKDTCGWFYAENREGKTQLFLDWCMGDIYGRGHIAGLVQSCIGGQYCEGNEHFYINGEMTPVINGTGTEDLYLACYWPNRKFDSPVAGCVNDVFEENGSTLKGAFNSPAGYYRFFFDMPIAFENGIRLDIQHGAVDQTYSEYSSTCFAYRIPEPSLWETDIIDLSSEGSKKLHRYCNSGEEYTLYGRIESDMRFRTMKHRGCRCENGTVSFKMMLRRDNRGAVLRRVYDKSKSNANAKVYIDGEFAGIWHACGENPHFPFADDDFYIPEGLTRNKEEISVEIHTGAFYSDFRYSLFSRT